MEKHHRSPLKKLFRQHTTGVVFQMKTDCFFFVFFVCVGWRGSLLEGAAEDQKSTQATLRPGDY